MKRWIGRYADFAYALMRIAAGALFACHGGQKLFGLFGGSGPPSAPLMLVAGIVEFLGGLLIMLGLRASLAAFIASGQMAVAYFMAHGSKGFWPILNRGELAVLYCFLFLYIATRGSGRISLDRLIGGKRSDS